jgi:uncharacterized membrane protein YfcA
MCERQNSKFFSKKRTICVLAGTLAGVINGLFGGGGGMIIVPTLCVLLKRQPAKAHATAILIILPLSVLSSLFYVGFGSFNLSVGLPVGIGVVFGGVIGAFLLNKLSSKWLIILFSLVMMGAGVKMLFF